MRVCSSLCLVLAIASMHAGSASGAERSRADLYRAAGAACHGFDGRGAPPSLVGFDIPPPDFTDGSFATREPAADWVAVRQSDAGAWQRGRGDVAVALKHVVTHSLERGHILSVSGEVALPTGKETQGLGKGVTVFEPFVTFGRLLPANGVVQARAGAELPADRAKAGREAFWRAAIDRTSSRDASGARGWVSASGCR